MPLTSLMYIDVVFVVVVVVVVVAFCRVLFPEVIMRRWEASHKSGLFLQRHENGVNS